ncbi:hypothetical protein G7Z17_g6834 [Cylindrodendrum hubeiense]|uniref:Peptidase M3A/M3B catalytic domain-containing protein n=1 Tax=Cylindrodendrum hubeiense TaxID=595255 RepID=A0A9P5LGD7_9HYPO|nr:hypothetical protein G7Z17_g6834 [Cylindrodendrum hubeiense]
MRQDLFELVHTVHQKARNLDDEDQHLLNMLLRGFERNGLSLPSGPQRDRFGEITKTLFRLKAAFQGNKALSSGTYVWFTLSELEGVPDQEISQMHKGSGEYEGMFGLTDRDLDSIPIVKTAQQSGTRRRAYVAKNNRFDSNISVMRDVIALRDEAARLLGYQNHAEFRLEDRMAKTPKAVNDFLHHIQDGLASHGMNEVEKLKELKREHVESRGESFDGHFWLWDEAFYKSIMAKKQHSIDQNKIKEYFSLETTLEGTMEIFQRIFGLDFEELKDHGDVWHKDVRAFMVWDEEDRGGDFLGYLYLDLFTREGKYSTPFNSPIEPGFIKSDGSRLFPSTALICNFSKPSPERPTLLQHQELVTLIHEFGHAVHDVTSKTKYARFHGPMGVTVDFGEAPSQLLEQWTWTPSVLKKISRHYSSISSEYLALWRKEARDNAEPPRHMPDEMINNLIASNSTNKGLHCLHQIFLCTYDLAIYQPESREVAEQMNITKLWNEIRERIYPIDGPEVEGLGHEWGHGQTNFGHVISEYDAGYYSYLL